MVLFTKRREASNTTPNVPPQESTYKDPSGCRLSRDEFARPVLGLGHESALELLLVLAVGLLFLLLGVVGPELGLLATAQEGRRPP